MWQGHPTDMWGQAASNFLLHHSLGAIDWHGLNWSTSHHMQIPSSRINEKEEGAEEPLPLKIHLGSSTDKVCLYSVDQHFVEWLLLPGGEAGKYVCERPYAQQFNYYKRKKEWIFGIVSLQQYHQIEDLNFISNWVFIKAGNNNKKVWFIENIRTKHPFKQWSMSHGLERTLFHLVFQRTPEWSAAGKNDRHWEHCL